MTVADIGRQACPECHSLGFRVEYEKVGNGWKKRTICCACRSESKHLN